MECTHWAGRGWATRSWSCRAALAVPRTTQWSCCSITACIGGHRPTQPPHVVLVLWKGLGTGSIRGTAEVCTLLVCSALLCVCVCVLVSSVHCCAQSGQAAALENSIVPLWKGSVINSFWYQASLRRDLCVEHISLFESSSTVLY